ncbi:hypothetical protein BDQ12DRAFT_154746 [Crucibulum laeve]|uniref:Uncharacterized protein n=1 Tax=Crucibulum laeve TaxID=68775 RepID=A0A5C3LF41_9AGAR|nr:hypothetical protein BDQ12DRAFT_154746 [Crucibulum laeve]
MLTSFATILLALQLVSAMPYGNFKRRLEQPVRRAAGSCQALSIDQAKTLPGWAKIQQYATDNYGTGGVNIVTNPTDIPNAGANVCVDDSTPVAVTIDGQPTCNSASQDIQASFDGTSGQVTFQQGSGTSSASTWSVTQSTSLATSVGFTVGFTIPDFGTLGSSISTTTTVTNEQSSSDTSQSVSVNFPSPDGKKCTGSLKTTTCTVSSKGSIPIIASGLIWFNYDDKRVAKNDPSGGTHYKYSVNIETVLTNKADRTGFIEFEGPVNTKSKSTSNTVCK